MEDKKLAEHRRIRDWERQFTYAIDDDRTREIHHQNKTKDLSTICRKYFAATIIEAYLK